GIDSDGTTDVWITYDNIISQGGGIYHAAVDGSGFGLRVAHDNAAGLDFDPMQGWVMWFNTSGSNTGIFQCKPPCMNNTLNGSDMAMVDLTFDGTNIYWWRNTAIFKQPKGSTSATQIVVGGTLIRSARSDGKYLYWLDAKSNSVSDG